jgi:hypothetical protein
MVHPRNACFGRCGFAQAAGARGGVENGAGKHLSIQTALRILDRLALGVGVGITELDDAARSLSDDRAIEYQHGPVRLVAQDSASRFIDSAASYQRRWGIALGCAELHRAVTSPANKESAQTRACLRVTWRMR